MINLTKGESVSLSKGERMTVLITWPATTDYDAGCEILYKDGTTESIAMFPARGVDAKQQSRNGTVRHRGDVGRGAGMSKEIIDIDPDEEIAEIAAWAYSAQSNGTGSFYRHRVSMEIVTADDTVKIDAVNADDDDTVYTCVPGVILFGDKVSVQANEAYSSPGSERRPAYKKGLFSRSGGPLDLTMDGPRNNYK